MKTEFVIVTPEMAAKLLKQNTNNRNLSQKTVDVYAREMKEGRWRTTHQGVAVYEDGTLADGQHRLAAVVKSGVGVKMLLTTGLPVESSSGVDAHRARSVVDIIKIGGKADWIDTGAFQTIRAMYTVGKVGAEEVVLLGEKVEDSVKFSQTGFSRKVKGATAGLRAAVALAHYYGENEERLLQFVDMFYSGIITDERDSAVVKVRDLQLTRDGSRGQKDEERSMSKIQNGLYKFLRHEPVKILREVVELPYPKLDPKPLLSQESNDE